MTFLLIGGWALAGILAALAGAGCRVRRARRERVVRACHELRGPITAVRLALDPGAPAHELTAARLRALDTELGRATLALEDLAESDRRAWVRGVRRRGARVGGSRVERLDRVALRPLLDGSIVAIQGRAQRDAVPVRGGWDGPEAHVWGDRLRLAQAVGNLLVNAIEHGGGAVRVTGELRGGCARIIVDDGGPGLPAPVAQLTRRARGGRGSRGRGLAIAADIARAHGGCLSGAPSARGGRIVLALPVRPAAAGGALAGAPAATPGAHRPTSSHR